MENTNSLANQRLISLDAFRGITVALMILVNDPGSWDAVYAPLLHAEWHGITPTDLVFPFFLFIVGVSIVLAFSKRIEKGIPKRALYKKIIIRSLKIFAVGIFLSLFPEFNFAELRIAGVLQRIAIVFSGVFTFVFAPRLEKAGIDRWWNTDCLLADYGVGARARNWGGKPQPWHQPGCLD
jgi:predicted acyltransferase